MQLQSEILDMFSRQRKTEKIILGASENIFSYEWANRVSLYLPLTAQCPAARFCNAPAAASRVLWL